MSIFKKIDESTQDQIMLGEYAGLTHTGKFIEEEPEFIGSDEQFREYEEIMHEEVYFDEINSQFHIGVGTNKIIIA